ncbi:MAG: alanyl-tRNA editing protein [Fusicatenibacter sp.]
MNTVKLYEQDPYLGEFEAEVLRSISENGLYRVTLNQTAFFPEGGGQPSDVGTLDGTLVTDVQEIDGEIWHTVQKVLEPGKKVIGKLNFEKRFSNMQNHCGEHIVSGIVYQMYGFHNVGFHMGSDAVTVDFDGILTEEQLYEIEQKANQVVLDNLPVTVSYPSAEELETLVYRSKKEIAGQVRLVSIEGVDCCACCGTHVASTGEIRLIKILGVQKYKGGVRVSMVSGERAYMDYCVKHANTAAIARLLSVKPDEAGDAVIRLKEKNIELKKEIKQLKKQIYELEGGHAAPKGSEK